MRRKYLLLILGAFCLPLLAQESQVSVTAEGFKSKRPGVWEARFALEKVPPEPLFIYLKAKGARLRSGQCGIEVRLNKRTVFRGNWDVSPTFWRIKRFPVSADSLRQGRNVLTISAFVEERVRRKPLAITLAEADLADFRFVPRFDALTDFEVALPQTADALQAMSPEKRTAPGFGLRGTKGWAWTPDQYLAEIPYISWAGMNFLMNCYTSMFTSLDPFINNWWEPLPPEKKAGFEEVVKACRRSGLEFCFSMHPQLFSERPLDVQSDEDFEKLWAHYAWMQSLGVKWFNVCYDDIGVEGQDKSVLGEAHAGLVNRLFGRLKEKTPDAEFIFCPTYYAGCGETPEARAYLGALARTLDPGVYLFWTGDGVVTPRMTVECARAYGEIAGHKLIIWDNYPVNDRTPTLHLGPVTGRDPGLAAIAAGYMSNPLSPQNEINRLPLFTCAAFASNPEAYDPWKAIGRSIVTLAQSDKQRRALKGLVELYPGMLIFGETRTSFNPVLERFRALLGAPRGRNEAEAFLRRVEDALERFSEAFPGQFSRTKATIAGHIAAMQLLSTQ